MSPQTVLTFPAWSEYLRLVRLASADMGSRAGFDFEEIDDLKIAVSEACSLALGSGEPFTLVFTIDGESITVEGSGPVADSDENALTQPIIAAVVDTHEIVTDDGTVRFRLEKRHRP